MIRKITCMIVILAFFSCNKNSKKKDSLEVIDSTKIESKIKKPSFEDKLLEIKDINDNFNDDLKVEKFGIQKVNDSIIAFVFKLDKLTSNEVVTKYSFGMRGYSTDLDKPFLTNFSPDLSIIDGDNYLVLQRKIKNTTYFDSLEVYIYERKNWKKSGKLGKLMIRDILFE